ncbi:hypothetical protein EOI86_03830 [Hwanghaeella grinnelliae]|uniref:DUF6745 domain-containing protein n=1 Tax=Hwanghaeella grinnelliae TaxID=2500179 RepID=A0A437QV91_9PROT|nr:hypothetical protein [Hwanghaeella grinnelliae]RVU38425.1 hypothetical protein EOI86_03830 [Hwanghaeella grinnelliae]
MRDVDAWPEGALQDYRNKWIGIGLSTVPADREAAERGIARAYRAAGFKPPRIVWCGSPMTMALVRAFVLSRPSKGWTERQADRLWAGLHATLDAEDWSAFRQSVVSCIAACDGIDPGSALKDPVAVWGRDHARAAVRKSADANLWESAGTKLAAPVRRRVAVGVWANLGRGIWGSVQGSVADNAWGGFRSSVRDAIRRSVPGQHDAGWLCFYDFFARAMGLDVETLVLRNQAQIASSAGWWLPHEHLCWISERPRFVAQDEDGVLHNASGPAINFRDGWLLHAWRGTLVPQAWIEGPATLTAKTALTHPNVEQRRAACEILGWEPVLGRLDARVIQADEDPSIGELVEVEIPEIGQERFLRVTCGTGRRFALPVPPHVTTALEANAWTYGLDADAYKPEVRT